MSSTSQPSRRAFLAGLGGAAAVCAGGGSAWAAMSGRPVLHGSPAKLVPATGSWFGAYPAGGNGDPGGYETMMGRKLDVVMRYEAFDGVWPNAADRELVAAGRWITYCWSSRLLRSGTVARWRDIAAGDYDGLIAKQANRMASLGPVWVGYDNEMDGRARIARSGPLSDYAAAYRRIQQIARPRAPEVVWLWCPTGYNRTSEVVQCYPGDDYVDWICYDPYDPDLRKGSPLAAYEPFPAWLSDQRIGAGKPLGICETGFHREHDSVGAAVDWVDAVPAALDTLGIRMWQWFNSSGGLGDTSIAPGSPVAAALRRIGGHPLLKQPHW